MDLRSTSSSARGSRARRRTRARDRELTRWVQAWVNDLASLNDSEVFVVGRSQATELDKRAPFGHLVLHLNRELIHHGSEIMTRQDLFAARHRSPGTGGESG